MLADGTIGQMGLLGLIQGLTEFLPVSSTAHLGLAQSALGMSENALVTDIVLHLGTLIAVMVHYWRDVVTFLAWLSNAAKARGHGGKARMLAGKSSLYISLFVSLLFTGLVGFAVHHHAEAQAANPAFIGRALIANAVILCLGAARSRRESGSVGDPCVWKAAVIGVAQGIGAIPGISRLGITLVTGLYLGLDGRTAIRYSLLLSVPTIASICLAQALQGEWGTAQTFQTMPVLAGVMAATVVGYGAVRVLTNLRVTEQILMYALWSAAVGLWAIL